MGAFIRNHWLALYGGGSVVAGLIHLALGAPQISVFCAVTTVLLSLIPAALYGAADMVALIVLMAGLRYAGTAIFYKLLLFEPIDRGLYNSDLSFTVILSGTTAMLAAAGLSYFLWQREPLFREKYTLPGLHFLWAIAGVLTAGAVLALFARIEIPGGISALTAKGFILLPIAWMASSLLKERPPLSRNFILFFAALSVILVGSNSRLGVALPFLATAVFMLSFRIKPSRKMVLIGSSVAIVFALVLAPLMTVVRANRDFVSTGRLIVSTLNAFGSARSFQLLELAHKIQNLETRYSLRYSESANNFLDRALNVAELDIVVDRAAIFGPIGTARFWKGLPELLPSFIVPEKPITATPTYALWVYGMINWGHEEHIELTTFGDAFTYGGMPFVIETSFALYFITFMVFRAFCPTFERSILAVFMLVSYGHFLTASAVLAFATMLVREIPFLVLVCWFATTIRRPFFSLNLRSA